MGGGGRKIEKIAFFDQQDLKKICRRRKAIFARKEGFHLSIPERKNH
jgi:hypothetical protein